MNLTKLLTGGNLAVASIVWPLMCGVFLAVCIGYFNKQTIGKLVKSLLETGADSGASAKTLAELGFEKKRYLAYALRSKSTVRNIIREAPAENDTPARYYIPEEAAYRAETVYKSDRSSPMTVVIGAIAFLVVTILLLNVIPELLQMTSNAIDGFKKL